MEFILMTQHEKIKEEETFGIRGDIEITHREILTDAEGNILLDENGKPVLGAIVDHFEEKNIVLTQGKGFILRAFADDANSVNTVKTIKIGSDVGTGTILLPEEPTAALTEADFDEVYETPAPEFFISYPSATSVRFLATINGANVMASYPTQPNVIYTSASIFTNEDKSVTYKRFPARTISALISVDISWTISIV